MARSGSRTLALAPPAALDGEAAEAVPVEAGLADVVTLQRRRQAKLSAQDEQSLFIDTIAEYQWARDAAGLAPSRLNSLVKPVIELCEYYGRVPWRWACRTSRERR